MIRDKQMTAIILTGGKNSRMNFKKKAFLEINGERFIDILLEKLEGFSEIILSCNSKDEYREFEDRCTLVLDEKKEIGPIGGIYSSLKKSKTEKNFIVSIDMPFLEKNLIDSICKIDTSSNVLVAITNEYLNPLFAVYKKSILESLERKINEGNYKLRNIILENNPTYFYVENSKLLDNINKVSEYEELLRNLQKPKVINIVASTSNSGKTTLIEGLIRELKKDGSIVSTLKHDVHGIDIDKKGKDTYRHREAGAENVAISSKDRFVLMRDVKEEIPLKEIIKMFPKSDYIIVEGYKNSDLKKIEVFRKGISTSIISKEENLLAIATDDETLESNCLKIELDDFKNMAKIIKSATFK